MFWGEYSQRTLEVNYTPIGPYRARKTLTNATWVIFIVMKMDSLQIWLFLPKIGAWECGVHSSKFGVPHQWRLCCKNRKWDLLRPRSPILGLVCTILDAKMKWQNAGRNLNVAKVVKMTRVVIDRLVPFFNSPNGLSVVQPLLRLHKVEAPVVNHAQYLTYRMCYFQP